MENHEDGEQIPLADTAEPASPWTDADLAAMLRRAVRNAGIAGAAITLVLLPLAGWQTAALFAVGGAISVGSIYEWGRMVRLLTARMDGQAPQAEGHPVSALGTGRVAAFFLLRLVLFAGVMYGSLKCLHGSPIALVFGLGLGVAGLAWAAVRTLGRQH